MNAKHVPGPARSLTAAPPPGSAPASPAVRTRVAAGVRIGWGLLLLTAPDLPARLLDPAGALPPVMRPVLRVLGARHVAQGVVTAVRPSAVVQGLGAGADALHAASAVGYGVLRPRVRRPALRDAGVAAGAAVVTGLGAVRAARRSGRGAGQE